MDMLWANKNAKKKEQPKPSAKPVQPGVLTQGNCCAINTSGLPKNGQEQIIWPGCMNVTFYESFTSNAAQAIWNATPNVFTPGGPPANPNASGLLIVADPYGNVQSRFPYPKGLIFALENKAITGGSYYTLTCPKPNSSFRAQPLALKSHAVSVTIPGDIYAGPATICGLGGPTKTTVAPKMK